jgi:hypothetical protein
LTYQPIDLVWNKVSFGYSKFAGFDMIAIQFLAKFDAMKHKKRIDQTERVNLKWTVCFKLIVNFLELPEALGS